MDTRSRLTDLDFADDLVLMVDSARYLQQMTDSLSTMARMDGLRIIFEKKKAMAATEDQPISILVSQQTAEEVRNFTYLGSDISNIGDRHK